ncbi:MAG: hypothetical protein GY899_05110 [Verrucomicrobiaceae bacterium]|nr:hypothetical protein [Verrucomicrobiaceae bacterium]
MAALTMFVIVVVGGFVVLLALRAYLHSDKFSGLVSGEVSRAFDADGEFAGFQWTGMASYTDSFTADGRPGAFFDKARADSIRARVNFGAVWDRVWEITDVDVDRLNVLVSPAGIAQPGKSEENVDEEVVETESGSSGGWLSAFLPKRVEVKRVGVAEVNFDYRSKEATLSGRGTMLEIKPTLIPEVYRIVAQGGRITYPGSPVLNLEGSEVRAGNGKVIIDRAAFELFDDSTVNLNGEVKLAAASDQVLDLKARFRSVPAKELLPEDWVKRLKGMVEAEVDVTGPMPGNGSEGPLIEGQARLIDGVFEAMPILDRLDEILGSSRFRRLSFNEFKVDFRHLRSTTTLEDVYLLASGTACLKGRAVLGGQAGPSGMYMLGVTPDVIKWLPLIKKSIVEGVFCHERDEAFAAVFGSFSSSAEKPPEGFRWAVCRIDPTAKDPFTADIRDQFFSKGGLALWAELVGAGERGLQAIGLLTRRAGEQGVDLMEILTEGAGQGTGGLIGRENLMRAAGELGVEAAMAKALDGLVEGVTEIPGTILRAGSDLLDGIIP